MAVTNTQIVVVSVLVIVLIGLWYFYRTYRKREQRKEKKGAFNRGLREIISGNYRKALGHLRKAAKYNPDNIVPYVYIGNIMRRFDNYNKAVEVHKSLLTRPSLDKKNSIWVRKEVVNDYLQAGSYEQAEQEAKSLLDVSKEPWVYALNGEVLELQEKWEEAYNNWGHIRGDYKDDLSGRLALLKVKKGDELVDLEEYHDARIRFKKAIKEDKECVPAYIRIGDTYYTEGRMDDAIEWWKKVTQEFPQKAYLIFDRLEEALFEIQNFREILPLYEDLFEEAEEEIHAGYALARIYMKMDKLDEAEEILEKLNDYSDPKLSLMLIRLYRQTGDDKKIDEILDNWHTSLPEKRDQFVCNNCSYKANTPLWHCPQCNEWNSFDI